MIIREVGIDDLKEVMDVVRNAFGREDEAELVRSLMQDPGARPWLSLLVLAEGRGVGHILFSSVKVIGSNVPVTASILAPMGVVKGVQSLGYGSELIDEGIRRLTGAGTELIFVLGHPGYYPRFGFEPALPLGFEPPQPIDPEHQDAWMVLALRNGVIGSAAGKVKTALTLDRPELWRE